MKQKTPPVKEMGFFESYLIIKNWQLSLY